MEAKKHAVIGVFSDMNDAAIAVHQERCAKVRNRNVECLKCAEACTSGCIGVVDGLLRVDASRCVGCGTCATVCPTCALEARNPSDAQLLDACLDAIHDGEVVVVCEQLRRALDGCLDERRVAGVVCVGRVDESLASALAVRGASRITLACGTCSQCAQEPGRATARLVADTANALFAAWGRDARVSIDDAPPAHVLCDGVSAEQVQRAADAYFAQRRGNPPVPCVSRDVADEAVLTDEASRSEVVRVMKDGTLPHFVPDRRERLLDDLASFGDPVADSVATRLWGCVVIDGATCSSCRMCATFCPTGALRKFDRDDGTFGIDHYPGECVKCGSCVDVCPESAVVMRDEVRPAYLLDGAVHHYVMRPRPVELGDAQQIVNTMRQRMLGSDIFER